MNQIELAASCYIHKELPLDDEELSGRHSAETLVCCDEEEGTHPADAKKKKKTMNAIHSSNLSFSQ